MSPSVEWIIMVSAVLMGLTEALDCIRCDWSAKNSTSVTDPCLEAPYKEDSLTCESSPGSERQVCTTKVKFSWETNQMSIESLERTCGAKHSLCNNECAEKTRTCWLCCDDTDRCNGFPVRTNIVTVTSGAHQMSNRMIWPTLTPVCVVVGLGVLAELLRNTRV